MKQIILTVILFSTSLIFISGQALKLDVLGDSRIDGKLSLQDSNGNIFIGNLAGSNSQAPGDFNIGIGWKALQINGLNTNNDFTADYNIAIGPESLSVNENGDDNVAIGGNAMISNVIGSKNVAIGKDAFTANTQGDDNIAIGFKALESSESGNSNIAIGSSALESANDEDGNISIGVGSSQGLLMGFDNVILGKGAFSEVQNGSENVIIGSGATINFSNSSNNLNGNVCIGANASLLFTSAGFPIVPNNQTVIGAGASSRGTNTVVLGNSDVIGVFMNEDGTAIVNSGSDIRMKREIKESNMGLSFILDLQPVSYKWKRRIDFPAAFVAGETDQESLFKVNPQINHGFIAQEVKEALDKYDIEWQGWQEHEHDGRQTLSYSAFVVPLVKAVQEQNTEISELRNEITSLKKAIESILSKSNF